MPETVKLGARAENLFCVVNGAAHEDRGIRFHERRAHAQLPSGELLEVSMPLVGLLLMIRIGQKYYSIDLEPLVTQVAEEHMARAAVPEWVDDPEATRTLLLIVGSEIPLEEIRGWTPEQRQEAERWASLLHIAANDHDDVEVPPRPDFIPWPEFKP